jgi:hypothetical protein
MFSVTCLILYAFFNEANGKFVFRHNPLSPPFIWNIPDDKRWFNVSTLLPKIPLNEHITNVLQSPRIFDVDPKFLSYAALRAYSQNTWREDVPENVDTDINVRQNFLKTYLYLPTSHTYRRMATLRNVTVSSDGHVYDSRVGQFLANGGCHQRQQAGMIQPADIPIVDSVISIAAMW